VILGRAFGFDLEKIKDFQCLMQIFGALLCFQGAVLALLGCSATIAKDAKFFLKGVKAEVSKLF